MSVEDDGYPPSPSRVFTQDMNFQRTAYRYPNSATDSLEAPESISASRIKNSPRAAREKPCQRVFKKLKGWLNRFLNYLT